MYTYTDLYISTNHAPSSPSLSKHALHYVQGDSHL